MSRLRIAVVGLGAFGQKHLEALQRIETAEVAAVVDADPARSREAAQRFGLAAPTGSLEEALADASIDAVILCTPTPLHAGQGSACLAAGKHVLIEIPIADRWSDVMALVEAQRATGKVAMGGHTRRFNPGHRWLHDAIGAGRFQLQHLQAQTFFLRRSNINLKGEPRGWTDHLLWHHAAHTVDLFAWQTGEAIVAAHALQGPRHPVLGIAMDVSIQLRSAGGALCTLALSFNNDGAQGSVFRYIGDTGTYLARYDDLHDGAGAAVDVAAGLVSTDGIELQDREFIAAITEGREAEAGIGRLLPGYRVLSDLHRQLEPESESESESESASASARS